MIPGWLVSIVTFPGVVVHEIAHQVFCRLARVAVFDACYIRLGNPAGYVVHEVPRSLGAQILIGVAPFLVNTVVGAAVAFPGAIPVLKFDAGGPLDVFHVWLGVSIAMHAFPSTGDAKSMWESAQGRDVPIAARIAVLPILGLIYLGALGSVFWLDFAFGIAVALLAPDLLISVLA